MSGHKPKPRPSKRVKLGGDPSEAEPINTSDSGERLRKPVSVRALSGARGLCTALRTDGEPCGNYSMKGSNVCKFHGGAAPQVKAAARVRLENAADRMAAALLGMAEDQDTPHAVKLAAIRDALDRAGLSAKQVMDVEVGLKPYQQTINKALRMRRPGGEPDEPRVIEGHVIEEYPALEPGEDAEPIEYRRPPVTIARPTPPREPHVNSDDTPPAHVRRKTPGYANTGGTRRTPTTMTR